MKPVTGLLVPGDSHAPLSICDIEGFANIQATVGELVIPIDVESVGVTLFVDANDRRKGLTTNLRASAFRWLWDPLSWRFPGLGGDVLLLGMTDRWSSIASIPTELLTEMMAGGPFTVELHFVGQPPDSWQRQGPPQPNYSQAAMEAIRAFGRSPTALGMRVVPLQREVGHRGEQAA